MNREEYNTCVAKGMTGKHLSGDERKLEFCVVAKTCSGKAKSREEAVRLCNEPKPEKPPKARRSRRTADGGVNVKKVATCVVKQLDPEQIPQYLDIANALSECL